MSGAMKSYLRIAANLYKGMPEVDVKDDVGNNVKIEPLVELGPDEHFTVDLNMTPKLSERLARTANAGKVSISLESLDVDLQHNQSFGMVTASTGCISNPGGPSC